MPKLHDQTAKRTVVFRKRSKGETSVIVAASFFGLSLFGGSLYCNGVFLLPFMEAFQQSTTVATWACSLNMGLTCIAGPLSSWLINRFGLALPIIVGTLLTSCAMCVAAFSTHIELLLLTYGILAGTAYSVPMTAFIVGIYINTGKHRSVIGAFAFTGTSLGAFVFPIGARFLLDYYGWRGALIIISGVSLHACALGFAFKAARAVNPAEIVSEHKSVSGGDKEKEVAVKPKLPSLCTVQFFLMITQSFVFGFAISVISNHFVAFLHSRGLSEHEGAFLLSASGLAGLVSRPSQGLLLKLPLASACKVYMIFCLVGGLSGLLMTCTRDKWLLLALAVLYGFCYNAIGPLNAESVISVVNIVRFSTAYGYNIVTMGFGFVLGAPVAGLLYDATKIYSYSFYFGGGIMVLSGLMMLPIICIIKRTRAKKVAKDSCEVTH